MAETTKAADKADKTPKIVQMPRTVHELITGTDPETDVIAPGTFVTEQLAKKHGLDDKAMGKLLAGGALELVDVHQA